MKQIIDYTINILEKNNKDFSCMVYLKCIVIFSKIISSSIILKLIFFSRIIFLYC